MITPETQAARVDRVADRLAACLEASLKRLDRTGRNGSLTDDEASRQLGALLEAQGIRLADGLVHALAARSNYPQ